MKKRFGIFQKRNYYTRLLGRGQVTHLVVKAHTDTELFFALHLLQDKLEFIGAISSHGWLLFTVVELCSIAAVVAVCVC